MSQLKKLFGRFLPMPAPNRLIPKPRRLRRAEWPAVAFSRTGMRLLRMLAPLAFFVVALNSSGAWPTLRGGPEHSGYVDAELKRPFRLAWAREFAGERLGTAMEP